MERETRWHEEDLKCTVKLASTCSPRKYTIYISYLINSARSIAIIRYHNHYHQKSRTMHIVFTILCDLIVNFRYTLSGHFGPLPSPPISLYLPNDYNFHSRHMLRETIKWIFEEYVPMRTNFVLDQSSANFIRNVEHHGNMTDSYNNWN